MSSDNNILIRSWHTHIHIRTHPDMNNDADESKKEIRTISVCVCVAPVWDAELILSHFSDSRDLVKSHLISSFV